MKRIYSGLCRLEKNINFWFILFTLFVFSLLRLPSLVEPDWYGDEGIYQVLGMAINHGRLLYKDIWDNKPPILYLIYSIFDGDLFSARALSLGFGIFSLISFYFLSKKLFESRFSIYFSTFLFAVLFGLPFIEGNIANAENFMLLPIILAGIFIVDALQNGKRKYYIFAGLMLSFAFLIKIVAVFDFFAFLVIIFAVKFDRYFSFTYLRKNYKNLFRLEKLVKKLECVIIYSVSFIIPVFLTSIFFLIKGAFGDFIKATFSQNVGYVGYGNYFLFPMGMLIAKILILGVILLLVLKIRKYLGIFGLFIYIWLVFSVFNALFSERPYPHYLLVLLPSAALLFLYTVNNKKVIIAKFATIAFLIFVMINNFNLQKTLYKQTVLYYENYLSFVSGRKTLVSYREFFDKNTTRDYSLANFIRTNTSSFENIFLWGDSAQVYALSNKLPPGRYTVAYHVTFYKNAILETKDAIDAVKPKYIIVTKNSSEVVNFLRFYNLKFIIKGSRIYEREI